MHSYKLPGNDEAGATLRTRPLSFSHGQHFKFMKHLNVTCLIGSSPCPETEGGRPGRGSRGAREVPTEHGHQEHSQQPAQPSSPRGPLATHLQLPPRCPAHQASAPGPSFLGTGVTRLARLQPCICTLAPEHCKASPLLLTWTSAQRPPPGASLPSPPLLKSSPLSLPYAAQYSSQ